VVEHTGTIGLTRRTFLAATASGGAGIAGAALTPQSARADDDEALDLIRQLTGRIATESERVRLTMPRVFATGYTVPLDLAVDSPMTERDHVRRIRVLAPRNPIVEVVSFSFSPQRSAARASTRIRLAQPQHVLAVAEMSDGTLLMAKTWVEVASNGCS
jgi:sulfur-oxidizing protein SoxY